MSTDFEKLTKKTKYDTAKQTKADNFKYLNEKYPSCNCTVLLGDSIVELWNIELFKNYARCADQDILNRGISGDTSDRMFDRLVENALNLKPKNLAILIGTNDIGHGFPIDFTVNYVEKSIKSVKELSPVTNLILISALPVNKNIGLLNTSVGKRTNEAILELNERYKSLCDTYKIKYLDVNSKLQDKKGRFEKDYTYDGLHPNIKGYIKMTPDLIELLK